MVGFREMARVYFPNHLLAELEAAGLGLKINIPCVTIVQYLSKCLVALLNPLTSFSNPKDPLHAQVLYRTDS